MLGHSLVIQKPITLSSMHPLFTSRVHRKSMWLIVDYFIWSMRKIQSQGISISIYFNQSDALDSNIHNWQRRTSWLNQYLPRKSMDEGVQEERICSALTLITELYWSMQSSDGLIAAAPNYSPKTYSSSTELRSSSIKCEDEIKAKPCFLAPGEQKNGLH